MLNLGNFYTSRIDTLNFRASLILRKYEGGGGGIACQDFSIFQSQQLGKVRAFY